MCSSPRQMLDPCRVWSAHRCLCRPLADHPTCICVIYHLTLHTTPFFQTVYFFSYTGLGCLALSLCTGTIGAAAATLFTFAIFSSVKSD